MEKSYLASTKEAGAGEGSGECLLCCEPLQNKPPPCPPSELMGMSPDEPVVQPYKYFLHPVAKGPVMGTFVSTFSIT